jgi:hypothetical protein
MTEIRLLRADEIEVKVKQVKPNGAVALLYKTARVDMDILDETYGALNWESDYKEIKGNLYCGIGIFEGNRQVWKWDCGIESREDDGNEKKGEASDAFKRAGFKCGIGRELYTAPFIFISANKTEITTNNGRSRVNDTFSVSRIEYTDRKISFLEIVNKNGNIVFSYGKEDKSEYKPKPETKTDEVQNQDVYSCEICKTEFTPILYKGVMLSSKEIYQAAKDKHGQGICKDCAELIKSEQTA